MDLGVVVLQLLVLGFGIALGIKWGGILLLKRIARDPELTEWLKQILNPTNSSR